MSNLSWGSLDSPSKEIMTPVVRSMLGRNTVEIDQWQYESLVEGSTGGGAVYRVLGTGYDQGESITWSLILKIQSPASSFMFDTKSQPEIPTHQKYWKRELLVYQSDLFTDLPTGLAVPRCYHIEEGPAIYRLWQEEVVAEQNAKWPLDRYGLAARHLGRFAGKYLVDKALPSWPWLATSIMRQREERALREESWERFPALWEKHETIRQGWPKEIVNEIQRVWHDREHFFRALNQLPQVVQHGDAGRKNLLDRPQSPEARETVAIDWGMVGIGAIGEEMAPLVCSTVLWSSGVQADQLAQLDEIVFDGYLQGLHDVGWRGDPMQVRLGYTATVALRFGPLIPMLEIIALDEKGRISLEALFNRSIDEIIVNCLGVRRFAASCATEARRLMGL